MLGKIIGNYQITHELAHGRTGTVYRGRHVVNSREVVIKEISLAPFPVSTRIHLRARFRRETFVQAQLNHPGIVRVFESFSKGDFFYLVIEYIHGMNLRELLRRQGLPTPAQAVFLLKQALAALEYAHTITYLDESDVLRTGVLHRDIKPENLMVDVSGKLKMTDFGIVRIPDRQSLAPPSFQPGTAEYMPPEQIRGLELDARSDIFSLGVTFYEILTGAVPYLKHEVGAGGEFRSHSFHEPVRTVSDLRGEVPEALSSIIMRAINRNAGERFQSAGEFLKAIRDFERNLKDESFSSQVISSPPRGSTGELKAPATKPFRTQEPDTPANGTGAVPETPAAPAPAKTAADRTESGARGPEREAPQPVEGTKADSGRLFRQYPEPAHKPARIYWLTSAILLIALGAIAAGYFLAGRNLRQPQTSAAIDTAWQPIPGDSPSQQSPPDNRPSTVQAAAPDASAQKLQLAREADRQGQFNQAISLYDDFLRDAPDGPEKNSVKSQLDRLRKFVSHMNAARAALNRQDYQAAKQNYSEALKLRPYSRLAQNSLAQAESKLAGNP